MSSSLPETAIFTSDIPELVDKKIQHMAIPEDRVDCLVYLLHYFLLTESDEELQMLYNECTVNQRSCQECKMRARSPSAAKKAHREERGEDAGIRH